ncbi:MAG TPA: FAD-dependent oxidoreductase [Roseomonas sp.]|jgi:pyruvate/2-oxoglutarate dehydrogenase complex dihydrolipoamide dehydrogenase (E3) component
MTDAVDVAVIGAGAAGLQIAAIAAGLGLRVALAERGRMGGTHLNTGCIPAKALSAAAKAAAGIRDARRFGIHLPPPEIDWTQIRAHVQGAIARAAPNAAAARLHGMGVEVVAAAAHFVAPDEIEAGTRRIRFRRCVIAAGSAPVVPNIPGLTDIPWLTNETLFDLVDPPGHLAILGGGQVGLEMAQAHARLGCLVTLIEPARIAAREDAELADGLRDALAADGVTLREGVGLARVARDGEGVALELTDGSRFGATHLLLAVGRAPRLASLDLVAGKVQATERGVATDAGLRSLSNPRVYAAGDIADPEGIGPWTATHVATEHAAILARRMLFRLPARLDPAALPRLIGTEPELAQVGLTEEEARAAGHTELSILRWPLSETGRAIADGRPDGMVKLVATPKGRLLGASLLGAHAGEMAGIYGLMIGRKLPLSALSGLVLPYPVLAEAGKRAAAEFYTPKLLSPFAKGLVGWLRHLP